MPLCWKRSNATLAQVVVGIALSIAGCVTQLAHAQAPSSAPDYTISQVGAPRGVEPKYVTLFDPSARWPATYRWKYNHANAPVALASQSGHACVGVWCDQSTFHEFATSQ